MLAAGGGSISWETGIAVLVGGYLCAGGAAAMNCYLDSELDFVMERTTYLYQEDVKQGLIHEQPGYGILVYQYYG